MSEETSQWVCLVCGYVYDGSEGPFEELPDDWCCPLCGASKDQFELQE
ncbi:MAG: rubredoxin [Actinomycetia bacterium]|nr:rubredoxin [Actinomycetes bacterium]